MKSQKIKLGNFEYLAYLAISDEEKEIGLQDVEELETEDGLQEGMLFIYDEPQHLDFWMKDTEIPLQIVFIGEDNKVISIKQGVPLSEEFISEDNSKYVFETVPEANINEGDILVLNSEFESDKLYVIGSDGNPQAILEGGERIFSRKSSAVIIRKAKKAFESQSDTDYKDLGRYIFNEMHAQDNREPEYVEN